MKKINFKKIKFEKIQIKSIKEFIIKNKAYFIIAGVLVAAGIAGFILHKDQPDIDAQIFDVDEIIADGEKNKEDPAKDANFTSYELAEKMQQTPDVYVDKKYEIYGKGFKANFSEEDIKYFIMVSGEADDGNNYTSVIQTNGYNEVFDKAIEDDKYIKLIGFYEKNVQTNEETGEQTCSFAINIIEAEEIEDENFSIKEITETKKKIETEEEITEENTEEVQEEKEEEPIILDSIEVEDDVDIPVEETTEEITE